MYFYVRSLENLVREESRSRLENRREKGRIKNVAALGEMEKIGAAGSGERERGGGEKLAAPIFNGSSDDGQAKMFRRALSLSSFAECDCTAE